MDMRLTNGNAWCERCDWKTNGKNSMANASIHYRRTLHLVHVELHYTQGSILTNKMTQSVQPKLTQFNVDISNGKENNESN